MRARIAILLGLLVVAGAACSDDGDDEAVTSATSTTTAAAEDVVIAAVDYRFEDVPETVPAGTRLRIENRSQAELHEIVALRLPEGEDRPLGELLALGQDGLGALVGGPPAAVLVQPPGGPAVDAVGDGTLADPGRYLLLCTIPTGADPDAFMAAAAQAQGGPVTGVEGGPPHLVQGMAAELVVE